MSQESPDNGVTRRRKSARAAEISLLGSLMRNPDEIAEVRDFLRVDEFHTDAHRRVYAALLRLHDRRSPIDMTTTYEALRTAGDLDDTGPELLAGAWAAGGSAGVVGSQAQTVLSLALEARLALFASQTLADTDSPTGPVEEQIERAQARLDSISGRVCGAESVSASDIVTETMAEQDARTTGTQTPGVATGFAALDDSLTGGLKVGQLHVLAARPSVGKTALSLQVVRHACERNLAVSFVSLEQRRVELFERLIGAIGRVPSGVVQEGIRCPEMAGRFAEAGVEVRGWRLRVNDRPAMSVADIAAGVRTDRRKMKGLDLVVVDYLGLIRSQDSRAPKHVQVGDNTRALREVAKTLNVPILLLCQLNREAADEVPSLHNLRDSGSIEEHADTVFLMHRASPRVHGRPDQITLNIAKRRGGQTDELSFDFDGQFYTFTEPGISE